MDKVKRFNSEFRGMIERPNGQFVFSADYYTVKAERDALAAANAALSRYISASAGAVELWNSWADAEDKLASAPEIPATYAHLNSVRAEGVGMAVNELKELAQRSNAESPVAAEHIHSAALYLMLFANQIRTGDKS